MDSKTWSSPVTMDIHHDGHYRVVTSAKEAAKVLSNEWPRKPDHLHDVAVVKSSAAMRGEISPEACRSAFIVAARAAGIPIING